MTKTLDDLEKLLTARGYPCKRILDVCVLTQLPTKAYTSLRTGTKSIEVQLAFDDRNHCLTMDTPWAFDSRQAVHKEAMLSCLLGEVAKSPLVRPQYDAEAGEVRLRVDGLLDGHLEGGVSPGNVVTMLQALPAFADSVYLQLSAVMRTDAVEPSPLPSPAPALAPEPSRERRLADIARRAGGVNRLAALFRMQERRRKEGGGEGPSRN